MAPSASSPAAAPRSSSARPVDMFFSGESAGTGGGAGATRSRDLASDMARDARSRRAAARRSKKSTPRSDEQPAVEPEGIASQSASAAQVEASGEELTQRAATDAFGSDDAVVVSDRAEVQKPRRASAVSAQASTDAAPEQTPADDGADEVPAVAAPEEAPAVAASQEAPEPVDVHSAEPSPEQSASAVESGAEPDDGDESAFDPSDLVAVPGAEFAELPINEIRENPRNPRTVFDEDALEELAFSLREVGVLQPVVVRPVTASDSGESFELVMGERRWRAAQRAGLTTIPAIIRDTSDDDLLRDALLENLHRSQLNPLEEAAAYAQLLEDFGSTQEELADRIGRSRPQITNTLRLLKLPPLVQRRVASGALSAGHARALLSLDDVKLQEELAARIVAEGLSVRAVERLISTGSASGQKASAPRRTTYNPKVVNLTSQISNRFETPVRIDVGKRKGKITFEFTNIADLERLAGLLGIEESELGTSE